MVLTVGNPLYNQRISHSTKGCCLMKFVCSQITGRLYKLTTCEQCQMAECIAQRSEKQPTQNYKLINIDPLSDLAKKQ